MRTTRVLLLSALVACSASKPAEKPAPAPAAPAAAAPAPDDTGVPRLSIEKYVLPNGLTVILHEDHSAPMVTVNVWYHVGAYHEPRGRSGFAHLFEHLTFQGSRHVPEEDHFRLLELAGATEVNGTTDFDRTNYFQTVPRESLPLALWLESDRMGFFLDTLDGKKLVNQLNVVKNEFRQHQEGEPYGMLQRTLHNALFPEGHPYRETPMGRMEDLEKATLDDVKAFFQTWYAPANATLCIAGDFERAEAKALVDKAFGVLPSGPRPPMPKVSAPPLQVEQRVVLEEKVARLPMVAMAWRTPPVLDDRDLDLDVLSLLLVEGKGSRLYRALVEQQRVAQEVSGYNESLRAGGVFTLHAVVAPGHTAEDVERAVDAELARVAAEGPTDDELQGVLARLELDHLRLLQSTGGMGGSSDVLQLMDAVTGDPGYLGTYLKRYRAVTAARLRAAVAETLRRDGRVVVTAQPSATPAPAPNGDTPPPASGEPAPRLPPADPWRAAPPPPLATGKASYPVPARVELPNGVTILVVEDHALPLVALRLLARAGAEADPADKLGRGVLTASMLAEGMEGADAAAQAARFQRLGTRLDAFSGHIAGGVTTTARATDAGAALHLLVAAARRPTLDPAAFERLRTRTVTDLHERLQTPTGVVMQLAMRSAMGAEHPYGRPAGGTVAGLSAVTVDDVKAAHALAWVGRRTALLVAGEITPAQVRALAEQELGDLPPGDPPAPPAGPPAPSPSHTWAVERPGAPQSFLLALRAWNGYDHPDHPALSVVTAAFGGNFSSRLNLNLREDKSISYGAFSFTQLRARCGIFAAGAPVQGSATTVGLVELHKEIRGMTSRPLTADEIALARDGTLRALPGMFIGVESEAEAMDAVLAHGLPLDHYATLPARVGAVTAEDTRRVAQDVFDPARMHLLLVGDRSVVEPATKAAGIRAVTWVDDDGTPLPAPAAPPVKAGKRKR